MIKLFSSKMVTNFTKRLFVFLLFVLFAFSTVIAQHAISFNAKLSANLQQYLIKSPSSNKNIVSLTIEGKTYLSALIKVNQDIDEFAMISMGAKIGTKAGDIWTVQIPEKYIQQFILIQGIDFIQLDEPIIANLDISRRVTRVDSVHRGINLPLAYSGKNVVVGIIDAGFDYSHPTFYDTTGTRLRIKRVWEQKVTGNPPSGFAYGNELTDTSAMLAKGTEIATFSHGTHVGGIAAGSGYGSLTNRKYRGMAYESDLVFVGIRPEKEEWKTMGMSSIIDGMNYIYKYAASVGKPAVVNLSWGCSIGPNDGSSLFSQACNNLTGSGRLFVLAAGNNGEEKIHIQKNFSSTDTAVHTFINFDSGLSTNNTWLDIWGEINKTFCIKLTLYNGVSVGNSSGTLCLNNTTTSYYIVGSDNDTFFYTVTRKTADYNGKPHLLLDIFSKTKDKVCLSVEAKDGSIHLWNGYVESYRGYYGSLSNNGFAWATAGDVNYTLGEMASTSKAITVAAFASKVSFVNLDGNPLSYGGYVGTNQIVPFSSHGPTADLRMKPDIAAPGLTIASAVNSYDLSYATSGANASSSVVKFNKTTGGKDYYYAESSGTSMASPAVAGILALMLQANPYLFPEDVQKILKETAIKDNFTTQIPDSTRWGAGKVNAYAAMKRAIAKVGIVSVANNKENNINLFPNPNDGRFYLEMLDAKEGELILTIVNLLGQKCFESQKRLTLGDNKIGFDAGNLTPGVYQVLISTTSREYRSRIIIN